MLLCCFQRLTHAYSSLCTSSGYQNHYPLFPMTWCWRKWSSGFYKCDYLIFCLFPAINLLHSATRNTDHSILASQPHNETQIKELRLEYCICGLRPAANKVNGNRSRCWMSCRSLSLVHGGKKTRQRKTWLVSFSGAQYEPAVNREGIRSAPLSESHFWKRPHQ